MNILKKCLFWSLFIHEEGLISGKSGKYGIIGIHAPIDQYEHSLQVVLTFEGIYHICSENIELQHTKNYHLSSYRE